ncbi:MAG: hypothetical protein WAT77_06065 [Paracoccaceae bacterium]
MNNSDEIDAVLAALDEGPHETFADVGGGALDVAIAVARRWGSSVDLIDMTRKGGFEKLRSDWVAPYLRALSDAGIAGDRVRVVEREADIRPVDMIANLQKFGDGAKIAHLTPVLDRAFHADSRMISDIRKGSGAFPFLSERGECEIISPHDEGGIRRTRVLFRPDAPTPPLGGVAAEWAVIARDLAGDDGFYRESAEHSFLFIRRDKTLIVTFDNLDIAMGKRDDRRPWGFAFIEKQGWSMLGVMANGWTWYRDPWVITEFQRLAEGGFFQRFDRVVFYGASMGGYAAAAFVGFCPGADVVAISPQSTLDKTVVPWETRYKVAWGRDFSGPFGDAADASKVAGRVLILYDPYEPLDRGHAERFTANNVQHLRTPLLGHRLGSSLGQMGLLSPIILEALSGQLVPVNFYKRLRARHNFPRYQKELFQRALARSRPGLARKVGHWVLKRGDNSFIRQAMASLTQGKD